MVPFEIFDSEDVHNTVRLKCSFFIYIYIYYRKRVQSIYANGRDISWN